MIFRVRCPLTRCWWRLNSIHYDFAKCMMHEVHKVSCITTEWRHHRRRRWRLQHLSFERRKERNKRNAVFAFFPFVFAHLESLSFDCAAESVIHAIYGILCVTLDVARMHISLQRYCFVDHICVLAQTFLAKLEFSGIHSSRAIRVSFCFLDILFRFDKHKTLDALFRLFWFQLRRQNKRLWRKILNNF